MGALMDSTFGAVKPDQRLRRERRINKREQRGPVRCELHQYSGLRGAAGSGTIPLSLSHLPTTDSDPPSASTRHDAEQDGQCHVQGVPPRSIGQHKHHDDEHWTDSWQGPTSYSVASDVSSCRLLDRAEGERHHRCGQGRASGDDRRCQVLLNCSKRSSRRDSVRVPPGTGRPQTRPLCQTPLLRAMTVRGPAFE